jgi:peptidoglycan/xylan/chitin deacetylase (PgdA/CDA1 family)
MTESHRFTRRQIMLGAALAGLAACDATSKHSAPPSTTVPPAASTTAAAPSTTAAPTTTPPAPQGPAAFVRNGPRSGDAVSLTFHASGDRTLASELLDLFQRQQVKVTVFGVGQWMAANRDLADRVQGDGHELANHTYTHLTMGQLSRTQIASEIVRCADVLRSLTGSETRWFRPSGIEVPTATILAEAGKAGYAVSVGYDVDSLDFQDPGASAVVANVRQHVQAGSIISLHFGHHGTIDALPTIIADLRRRQLRPVTVGELLA